ncbi:MAG TPA: hypothetical protein VE093_31250 [Polyangiaceae bacterium]|nr:hypothetical protein [Polyangiaceae bacterium]
MGTAVTLERYAEMRAEMDVGGLRDDVLAHFGMTADEWIAAQREWLERMGAELERGRLELTNRYTQAFLSRQRALQAPKPPAPGAENAQLPAVEPMAGTPPMPAPPNAPSAVSFAAVPPYEDQAAWRPAGVSVPAFPSSAAITDMLESVSPETTQTIPFAAQIQAAAKDSLPFTSAATSPPTSLAASPVAEPERHRSGQTLPPPASEQIRKASKSSLPFQSTDAPSTTKPPELAALVPPPLPKSIETTVVGETVDLTSLVEQLQGGLPYRAAHEEPQPGPPRAAIGGGQVLQASPGYRSDAAPRAVMTETSDISDSIREFLKMQSGSPLPFRPAISPSSVQRASSQALSQGARPLLSEERATSNADEAPTIVHSSSAAVMQQFAQPPAQIPTLAAYAQICAELRRDPARAAGIRMTHGLTDDSVWHAALRYWQGQLTTPAIRDHWAQLVDQMMRQDPGVKR